MQHWSRGGYRYWTGLFSSIFFSGFILLVHQFFYSPFSSCPFFSQALTGGRSPDLDLSVERSTLELHIQAAT